MNLSTFIHSEKERHGLRSMKIEPTLDVLRHPFIDGDVLFFRNLPIAAGDKLYTEAQLRQRLVKALHCWMA